MINLDVPEDRVHLLVELWARGRRDPRGPEARVVTTVKRNDLLRLDVVDALQVKPVPVRRWAGTGI